MVRDEPSRRSVITVVAALAGGVAVVGLMALLATRTHPGAPARFDALVATLVVGAPFALLWILAAAGYGTAIVRPSAPGAARAEAGLVVGVGVAVLLTVDAALGALGVLHLGGGIGGWIVIAGGLGLLGRVVWRARRRELGGAPMDAIVWLAAPAVATLLVAACVAPGWLWATEFGGYDALSYHLGLPAEWVASGRLRPLEHNVYSALPNYVEGAYLHIDLLVGDAVRAAASCQLLHAMFTLLGAWIVGRAAARLAMADDPGARSTVAAIATALVLVTPWVVVVGSLAYDEAAVNLLLATALLALVDPDIGPRRAAALAGVAAGAACGAKLTSVGFVVAPLVACLLITRPARRWAPDLAMMMLGAAVVGAPYLVRNVVALGNPVFPFATDWFGQAHWSDAQVAAWRAGHAAEASPVERLGALWNQWLRFGIGPDPSAPEPWRPQWGALPWLGLAGLVVAWLRTGRRRVVTGLCALLVVQIVFWMLFTHLKSRFLLPTVVPLSLLGALAWSGRRGTIAPAARIAAGSTILLLSTGPVVLFLSERDGAPADEIGAAEVMSGRALSASEREMAGMALSPIIATNYVLDASARVLLVGEAVPLYYRLDRITYATTWDRGPMSEVVAAAPDDPAAWVAALRARGFTHVLVNPIMLDLWTEAGWNDPNLTPARILDGLRAHARVRLEYADGRTLFELR